MDRWMDKEDVVYTHTHTHTNTHTHTHTHTMEYYSAIKKEWNNVTCSNMDGPRDYHTKWSKSDKDKYYMISHMWNLKNGTTELIYKTEIDSQT